MPIKLGWEVSPDSNRILRKLLEIFPIGDPIITSKCKFDGDKGFLVVSDNGLAWTIKIGIKSTVFDLGKKKWVRWYDVVNVAWSKDGFVLVQALQRKKDGEIKRKKEKEYKTNDLRLNLERNKDEPKDQFKERKARFGDIMWEIFQKNQARIPPAKTDSQY